MKRILSVLLFTGVIAGESNIAFARWATYHDADTEIQHTARTLYINKEGISSDIYELRLKILKEGAKANWANYTYPYNSNTEIVKILEAFTSTNGQKYHVNPSKIRKQSVVPSIENPSNETKIIIPYSNLKIGSIVYLKSKVIDLVPQLENFYSTYFTFGKRYYTHSASVSVTSELPLQISINDPDKVLNIKDSIKKEGNKILYCLEINQKKSIYKNIVDEDKIHFDLKHVPLVFIQATPAPTHFQKIKAFEYAKIKNQALPALYQKIANIAKTKSSAIDKIDTVTALLHKNITYLINPKYRLFPQSLQQVVDTGHGDCKDFSVATCAILQAIGISAKIVTVISGEMALPFPSNLPGSVVNHAIVKVELPEGPLWIDPTYPVGMAKYISVNIANRKATVLHDDYATYEDIPSMKSEDYRLIKHETWDMKEPSQIHIKGVVQLLGCAAGGFTGKRNILSEAKIKEMLLSSIIGKEHEVLEHNIVLPDLNSRIIEDLVFNYTLTVKNTTLKTEVGNTLPISFNSARLFMSKDDAVSAIYLGPPRIYETYITLQNINSLEEKDSDCHVESKWVDLVRTVHYEKDKHQALIHRKMEVKKSWIEDTELGLDTYKKLQLDIPLNFIKDIAIAFESS